MDKHKGEGLHTITFILLIIGGLNWLVLALFNWEIGSIFGGMDAIVSKIIYILIGFSAIYELISHRKCCSMCQAGGGGNKCPDCGGEAGKCSCSSKDMDSPGSNSGQSNN